VGKEEAAAVVSGDSAPPDNVNDIQLRRDAYGIAHIETPAGEALFWAEGYIHALDRWVQMDRDRRRAYGRLAELYGSGEVASDRFWRPLGLRRVVQAEWAEVDAATRAMLMAYADGVNAALSRRPDPLYRQLGWPADPWQPVDSLAVFKVRHLLMGVVERKLWWGKVAAEAGADRLLTLARAVSGDSLVIVPPGTTARGLPVELAGVRLPETAPHDGDGGSNNWVLAPSKTATGFPMVAGDPHREVELPNVYYPLHLAAPDLDVIGLSFPGVPGFPHFGHNARVAWAITHTGADTQDLYVEDASTTPDWTTWTETIEVRGASAVRVECAQTPRGPLIARQGAWGLSLRATALDPVPEQYACLYRMIKAQTVADLFASQRHWVDPVNNLVAADRDGHIGYLMRGRVPLRPVENLLAPVPAADARFAWQGFIPFEEWPTSLDPADGVIVTANNRVVGPEYPYPIAVVFAAEHRARRIWNLLTAADAPQVAAEMARVHLDVEPGPTGQFRRRLDVLAAGTPAEKAALDVLADWDGRLDAESPAPLIYNTWRQALTRRVWELFLGPSLTRDLDAPPDAGAAATFGRLRARILDLWDAGDRSLLPATAGWDDLAGDAFRTAVRQLTDQYGGNVRQWRWGAAHRVSARHPLATQGVADLPVIDAALPGDSDTVRAASYGPLGFGVTGASVARYVFDLGDWDRSLWIIPGGVQEIGPHALDQWAGWLAGEPVPMWYSRAAVEAHVVTTETVRR
jgi:penicillin amidase